MARDPYALCPCGSGKKLKFCCQVIADDIERIQKLRTSNQPKLALQSLSKLREQHPTNPWIVTTETAILLSEGDHQKAFDLISEFSQANPDNSLALALHATAAMLTSGLLKSRKIIHRAFQRSSGNHPELMCNIAVGIASVMHANDLHMACRQHLALAMRLAPQEDRQSVFMRMLELESNHEIAYPFRSVHQLLPLEGLSEEDAREAARAQRLADIGCFGPSAKVYGRLLESNQDQGKLWFNLGLTEAWDGDEQAAAVAFHNAAARLENLELSVEAETLAQLLDHTTGDVVEYYGTEIFLLDSVSASITALSQQPLLQRISNGESGDESNGIVARYRVLAGPLPDSDPSTWAWTDVPRELGTVLLTDADPENNQPGRAILSALVGDDAQRSREILTEALGSHVTGSETVPEEDLSYCIARDFLHLPYREYDPPEAAGKDRMRFRDERWQHAINDVWPVTPLLSLRGKSPQEAAQDPELKVALRAAIHVLDTFCNQSSYPLDVDAVCERLGIPVPEPIEASPELPLGAFTAMQLNRLPVDKLTDQQLTYTLNRALLLRHPVFLYKVLTEVVARPQVLAELDATRVFGTLSELAVGQGNLEAAIRWVQQAYELPVDEADRFEHQLRWRLRELSARLFDPSDEKLGPLIDDLWNNYGRKVPELQNDLRQVLERYKLPIPSSSILATTSQTGTQSAGLWTPDKPNPEAGSGGQLWLPGSGS